MKKAIQLQEHDADIMMEYAEKAGYEYISLGFGSSKIFHEDNWENRISELSAAMDKYHLKCVQTHLPYYDLRIDSSIIDEDMEEAIRRCIKATAMLGAKWTAMHLRSAYDHNFSESRAYSDNCRCIEDYLTVARKAGAGIALENLPIFPGAPQWHFYSSHYEDICAIADKYKGDNMGICWDFGHAHITGLDGVQALEYVGDRLRITHIHDNFDKDDNHIIPTLGTDNWERLMPVLKKIGYTGPLTLEIDYKINPVTESFTACSYKAVEYLEKLMDK